MGLARIRPLSDFRRPFFDEVLQFVVPCALRKVLKQIQTPLDPQKPCSGHFRSSMGLPCNHEIKKVMDEGRKLQLTDIYEYWYFDRPFRNLTLTPQAPPPPPPPPSQSLISTRTLQNPPVLKGKGRPLGSKNVSKPPPNETHLNLNRLKQVSLQEGSVNVKIKLRRLRRLWGFHSLHSLPNLRSLQPLAYLRIWLTFLFLEKGLKS